MRINLTNLINLVGDLERKLDSIYYELRDYSKNTSIQELDGSVTIMEDYKERFENTLKKYLEIQEKLPKYKAIIYEKNNSLRLPDGRSVQVAIADNRILRKVISTYNYLASNRSSKKRETEVNNSYFLISELNYAPKFFEEKVEKMEKEIQNTDFEISKLNSIEFDIDE